MPATEARPESGPFDVGDFVEKKGGDYTFSGQVVSRFAKRSGAIRYVVEDARGMLMIYSAKNLWGGEGKADASDV